jgi:hypothetical protein
MLTPRASMKCIGTQVIPMGIGTATAAIAMLADATHVSAHPAGGENTQSMSLACTVSGSAQTASVALGAVGGAGAIPYQAMPVPVPVHTTITAYNLRRSVTTAAIDYVVFFWKMN